MLTRLTGTIGPPDGKETCVDVRGIGYAVLFSDRDRSLIAPRGIGGRIVCLVRHVVREDSESLFGFFVAEESDDSDACLAREIFDAIVKVKGAGPSVAMKVLSAFPAKQARLLLSAKQQAAIVEPQLVKAVGKITGAKLVGVMP